MQSPSVQQSTARPTPKQIQSYCRNQLAQRINSNTVLTFVRSTNAIRILFDSRDITQVVALAFDYSYDKGLGIAVDVLILINHFCICCPQISGITIDQRFIKPLPSMQK